MLLKIDIQNGEILQNKNGRIIIKLKYYSQYATAAHLCTVEGETLADFENNKAKSAKQLVVGSSGGLSLE